MVQSAASAAPRCLSRQLTGLDLRPRSKGQPATTLAACQLNFHNLSPHVPKDSKHAMHMQDGYAVIAADGAGEFDVVGESRAGHMDAIHLQPGQVAYITTGRLAAGQGTA